jgi:peptidoglycan/xylan/chitin deacetylase (PgdA/CDA1 family)
MIRKICHAIRKPVITCGNIVKNFIHKPVIILLYHRVSDLKQDPQLLAVSENNFREHLQLIKNSYQILNLGDDWSCSCEPSVVITFDDGYADNYLNALPILEESEVHATFFISTGYVNSNVEFWWDELERIILLQGNLPTSFELETDFTRRIWHIGTTLEQQFFYHEMHRIMRSVDYQTREKYLEQLRSWAKTDNAARESHRPLSLAELQSFAQSKYVTIGAHTITHTPLVNQSIDRQYYEIYNSKRQLEKWLDKEVTLFSYPFGSKKDYCSETINTIKRIGFKKAVSNFSGQWHVWDEHYQIPRHLVRNWDRDIFLEKLKCFFVS